MKSYMLNLIFAVIVSAATRPPPTTTTTTTDGTVYNYTWVQETDMSCQSQSGRGSGLLIGEDGRTFDLGITIKVCKDKCAKHDDCQGFDYQAAIGRKHALCRYKGHIDKDTLTPERATNCYIYLRPSVVPLTLPPRTTAPPPKCVDLTGCLGTSCDEQIRRTPTLTCSQLERQASCNCKKCNCPAPKRTTPTTTPVSTVPKSTVTFKFKWTVLKGADCVTHFGTSMHIGEDLDMHGNHKTYDTWSLDKCKVKCAANRFCKGFNYESAYGICRYKITLSHGKSIPKPSDDCWVYDRDGSTPAIATGARITTTTATTTTPTYKFRWLVEEHHDCASLTNLPIGDKLSKRDVLVRLSYDIATVEQCKAKCAKYAKCDGFNYEFEQGLCRYKSGVSTYRLLPERNHNCYVYMRSDSESTAPSAPSDTCADKVNCLRGSCDSHIAARPSLTCVTLEALGCNCKACQCLKPTTTGRPTRPAITFKYAWNQYVNKQCSGSLKLFPDGSNLPIGSKGTASDDHVTSDYCKRVCARDSRCLGFDFSVDPVLEYGVCRYKAAGTKLSDLKPAANHSCFVYSRPTTTPALTSSSTCGSTCFGGTCEAQILKYASTTKVSCAKLEIMGCNCKGCNCAITAAPVATTSTSAGRTASVWKKLKDYDCVSDLHAALHIGETVDAKGVRSAYDKWPLDDCKAKCASSRACKGFNYLNVGGICRYKNSLSHAEKVSKPNHDCWVYEPDGAAVTIPKGTVYTAPLTTASYKYSWLHEPLKGCASAYTRDLFIGFFDRGVRESYDVATVDHCKKTCAQYPKCDGFDFEVATSTCRYKAGISTADWRASRIYDCYVYKRPEPTRATRPGAGRTTDPTRPSAGRDSRPTAGRDTRPTAGRATGRPTVGRATGRPTAGRATGRPTAGRGTGRPTAGRGTGRPTAGRATRPTAGRATRPPAGPSTARPTAGRATLPPAGPSTDRPTAGPPATTGTPSTRAATTSPTRPTVPTIPRTAGSASVWQELNGFDCVSGLLSQLYIGEKFSRSGVREAYDKWSVDKCKAKCLANSDCKGFNYNNDLGICRYKRTLSHAKTIFNPDHDCWVYEPDGAAVTIATGTTFGIPSTTTTTVTYQYKWLYKKLHTCSSVDTQDLHIGDIDDSSGDNKRTYDSATVDQCKAKCAKYAKCDGFNYEIHSLTCYYKTGVSTSLPRSSTVHDCYVYMRPTVTSATRARTTATPTTTVLKTRATLPRTPAKPRTTIKRITYHTRPKAPKRTTGTTITAHTRPRKPVSSVAGAVSLPGGAASSNVVTPPSSSGVVTGAVVGTLVGVVVLAGAVVAVICILKTNKKNASDVQRKENLNANNLLSSGGGFHSL